MSCPRPHCAIDHRFLTTGDFRAECLLWPQISPFQPKIAPYSTAVPIVGHILTALIGYLLGSIPTGFLVAKARGLDIRTTGSGNIGATNVVRQFGIACGILVLVTDILKG